jgi:hypothetical protein
MSRSRARTITMPPSEAARIAALLTTLDDYLRSGPASSTLAAFLASRGSRSPEFDTTNLIDELSLTAMCLRKQLASCSTVSETGHNSRYQ